MSRSLDLAKSACRLIITSDQSMRNLLKFVPCRCTLVGVGMTIAGVAARTTFTGLPEWVGATMMSLGFVIFVVGAGRMTVGE